MNLESSVKQDAPYVIRTGSDRYLLFKLKFNSPVGSDAARVPLNLSLVLDRSGSMGSENKMELVKKAAVFVVERLSPQDRVSVIAYDDEIRTVAKSVKALDSHRQEIAGSIKGIHTGGSTNLSEGWLTGCREIAQYQTETRYIDCAWLLTDGLANAGIVDQEELAKLATQWRKRGVSTTTFGVGLDFNENLLRAMAEKGGGHFYFIESSKQIKNYFEGELGERLNTVARNAGLQISLPEGVKLENLNEYEVTQGKTQAIVHLGDFYAGEEKEVLVKLTLPAGTIGKRLTFDAILMYTDAKSGQTHEVPLKANVNITYQEGEVRDIEPEIKPMLGKLLGAKAKQDIIAANVRGDYEQAGLTSTHFANTLDSLNIAQEADVRKELEEVQELSQLASAAPLEEKAKKSAFFDSHMKQRSRKDYKKEEDE